MIRVNAALYRWAFALFGRTAVLPLQTQAGPGTGLKFCGKVTQLAQERGTLDRRHKDRRYLAEPHGWR